VIGEPSAEIKTEKRFDGINRINKMLPGITPFREADIPDAVDQPNPVNPVR